MSKCYTVFTSIHVNWQCRNNQWTTFPWKITHCSGCISACTRPHEQSVNKELFPTLPLSSWVRRTKGCKSHIIRLCEVHFYVTVDGQGFGKKRIGEKFFMSLLFHLLSLVWIAETNNYISLVIIHIIAYLHYIHYHWECWQVLHLRDV